MKEPGKTNYEITRDKMQTEFLKYNQEHMIEKFQLQADEKYLYLEFVGRAYRVSRKSGKAEWSEDGFQSAAAAGFEEAMSIYDVLCCSKENLRLSGQFVKIESLPHLAHVSAPGGEFFAQSAGYFDHRTAKLARACEALGGIKKKVGDVSYQIPVFSFLPMQVQFWESDEEFPASLQFMWDEKILDYMHFETTFYVTGHVIQRLRELADKV